MQCNDRRLALQNVDATRIPSNQLPNLANRSIAFALVFGHKLALKAAYPSQSMVVMFTNFGEN